MKAFEKLHAALCVRFVAGIPVAIVVGLVMSGLGHPVEGQSTTGYLYRLAGVSMSQAVTTASRSHEGRLVGAELEVDDGRLVYEVEMMTSKGEMEVLVDAGDGHIVADTDDGDEEGDREDSGEDDGEDEDDEEGESSFLGATVSLGEALKRALEVRSGWAVEAELEERGGRLAYFIDVRTQADEQVTVRVDARSGEVHIIRRP